MVSKAEVQDRLRTLVRELAAYESESRALQREVCGLELMLNSASTEGSAEVSATMLPEYLDMKNRLRDARSTYVAALHRFQEVDGLLNGVATTERKKRLEALYTKVQWRPGMTYRSHVEISDDITCAQQELVELYDQLSTHRTQLARQTATMAELADTLDSMKDADEQLFQVKTDVSVKQQELRAVGDEVARLHRIFHRKEGMVILNPKDDTARQIRQLEADRRVAQHKLMSHREQVKQADSSIRARALIIRQLEEKIELIGEALQGDADPTRGTERVDAAAIEELRREIDDLAREKELSEERLLAMDADMEDLEARVAALAKATANASKEEGRIRLEQKGYSKRLEQETMQHAAEFEVVMKSLEEEVRLLAADVLRGEQTLASLRHVAAHEATA